MATTARLDLSIWRNDEVYEFKLTVRGLDLTGQSLRAQIRLAPDTPGAALADLYTVTSATAEGIRLAGVSMIGGIPVSDVRIRINKTTRQAFPYAGEVGDSAKLAWAMSFADQTRLVGNVFVLAHTLASDSAPTDRPGSGASSDGSFPNASATLTVNQDAGATVSIDGLDQVLPLLADAQAAIDAAVAAIENPRPVSLADADRNHVVLVDGAYYKGGGAAMTGALQVSLPRGVTDARFTVIEGFMMDVNGRYAVTISGSNGGGGWDYPIVTYTGSHALPFPRLRFGRDADLRYCFWMGETNTQWAYPSFWITRVLFGNNVIPEGWMGQWDIKMVTSFANLQTGPIESIAAMPTINPTFTGTMNGLAIRSRALKNELLIGSAGLGDTFIGNGTYNHLITNGGGLKITSGFNNSGLGLEVFQDGETLEGCTATGLQSQQKNKSGRLHTSNGIHALLSQIDGVEQVATGPGCLEYNQHGSRNVGNGPYALRDNLGDANVATGPRAGMYWTGSNRYFVANNPDEELIGGDFALRTAHVNGTMTAEGFFSRRDNVDNIGSGSRRFANIFVGSGVLSTSDERQKKNIGAIPDAWLDAWGDVRKVQFQYKGGKRKHVGYTAQQVHGAFAAHGIDAFSLGLCGRDAWEDETAPVMRKRTVKKKYTRPVEDPKGDQVTIDLVPQVAEDGSVTFAAEEKRFRIEPYTKPITQMQDTGKTKVIRKAGEIWNLRPDQCAVFEAAYREREFNRERARNDVLEARLAKVEKLLTASGRNDA